MRSCNMYFKAMFYIGVFGVAFASCQRDEVSTTKKIGSDTINTNSVNVSNMTETRQAAEFAYDILGDTYYWKDKVS